MTLNGALAGLVSVTASCSVIEPWAAVVIGIVGACVYVGSSMLVLKVGIDDVVDAGPVHYFCGMWGLLAAGLFCTKENLKAAYEIDVDIYGLFYGGGGKLLACQVVGLVVISLWVFAMMLPFFLILKKAGMLRVEINEEEAGLDISKHGGAAYEGIQWEKPAVPPERPLPLGPPQPQENPVVLQSGAESSTAAPPRILMGEKDEKES